MDKINIVKEWLDFASKDISSAKYLLDMRPVQQDIEPSRTHDLRLLCKKCADFDKTFNEISQSCVYLTAYGVQPRYPFEIEIIDSDMQKAVVDADCVMNFTLQKLNF